MAEKKLLEQLLNPGGWKGVESPLDGADGSKGPKGSEEPEEPEGADDFDQMEFYGEMADRDEK